MINRIRQAFAVSKRRQQAQEEFEAAHHEIRRYRPQKAFRQREWFRESDVLDLIPRFLAQAATVEEIDKRTASIKQIVTRCKAQVETETRVTATIDAAQQKADGLRLRAAKLQGRAFALAEHRVHTIKDECNHARRAKDARAEEAALKVIEEKLQAFQSSLENAEHVNAAIPLVEARIAAIEPQEIWLDTGAKETYDDLLATFAETQKDVKRGDYDKAAQRLREIEALEANLRDRGTRRADWAQQEIAMWRTSPSVAQAFPELAQFPAKLTPADIEALYGLREQIERHIATVAMDQRENNRPTRDLSTGHKLAATHPLRMAFDRASKPADLEEFLRCVVNAGR